MNKIYIYLINSNFNFVFIRNDNASPLIISRRYKISSVIKYEAKKGYLIQIENHFLTTKIIKNKKLILKKFINLVIPKSTIEKIIINSTLKTRLSNEITIYGK